MSKQLLPIKKLYIDSRFRSLNSQSSTDCKIPLKQSVQLPDRCVAFIDDIIIPHAWYSVENYNNKLYFRRVIRNTSTDAVESFTDHIFALTVQNHTGDTVANNIKALLNDNFGANQFDVVYNARRNTITITSQTPGQFFHIWTDLELSNNVSLSTGVWSGASYDSSNLQSINSMLRNENTSQEFFTYESGFIDLLNVHNLYIQSPNLGSFNTLGARGEQNIIKKVPVSSNFGYLIIDQIVSNHDYIDVSRQVLTQLEFRITDTNGNIIDLHGASWSASVVFTLEGGEDN